jgi:hypothetical protein
MQLRRRRLPEIDKAIVTTPDDSHNCAGGDKMRPGLAPRRASQTTVVRLSFLDFSMVMRLCARQQQPAFEIPILPPIDSLVHAVGAKVAYVLARVATP